ncbi:MAG: TolC family protein, partial [Odoribacter sp.]|nr:TolC family protein [Odoribacter sp.]
MKRFAIFIIFCTGISWGGYGQDTLRKWDLKSCIEYALEHNIQVEKSKLFLEESRENTLQAKSQLFPSLSFSTGHNLENRPYADKEAGGDKNSYSGSYGLNSSVALYNGGRLRLNIRQQELSDKIQELYIREAGNNIQVSITESYLQILYAAESVEINRNTVEVSEAQCERAKQLLEAGALSRSDVAQLVAQYSSDKYQLVAARSALEEQKLVLKQLLELNLSDEMELFILRLSEQDVLRPLPSKDEAYTAALAFMPEIESSRLAVESAGYDVSIARSGYLPSLNLSAGIGSGHISGTGNSVGNQLKRNFNESIGLTLSVPIYSNHENKSAMKLARLKVENADLDYRDAQKEILKTGETVY